MVEKQITVDDRQFTIRELKYKELTEFTDLEKSEAAKKIILVSTGMTEEEYNELSIKEGIKLQTEINVLNGLEDFQAPPIQ